MACSCGDLLSYTQKKSSLFALTLLVDGWSLHRKKPKACFDKTRLPCWNKTYQYPSSANADSPALECLSSRTGEAVDVEWRKREKKEENSLVQLFFFFSILGSTILRSYSSVMNLNHNSIVFDRTKKRNSLLTFTHEFLQQIKTEATTKKTDCMLLLNLPVLVYVWTSFFLLLLLSFFFSIAVAIRFFFPRFQVLLAWTEATTDRIDSCSWHCGVR